MLCKLYRKLPFNLLVSPSELNGLSGLSRGFFVQVMRGDSGTQIVYSSGLESQTVGIRIGAAWCMDLESRKGRNQDRSRT
jgi:hypothetical protein